VFSNGSAALTLPTGFFTGAGAPSSSTAHVALALSNIGVPTLFWRVKIYSKLHPEETDHDSFASSE
jgi:hypothetical protein